MLTRGRVSQETCQIITRATLVLSVFGAGCVSGSLTAQPAHASDPASDTARFVDPAILDRAIPAPESVIGHVIGDGAVRYEPMVRYFRALADASPLVTLTPYANSHEGRTLYYLTITSEANRDRLDRIKADNAKLADPRTLGDEGEADRILDTLPGVAWMAYSIHGDELSSTDAAVQLAYQLAAGTDSATRSLRDELVIHIDPLMNPDGRERYLGQIQALTGKISNPDYQAMQHMGLWSAGRGNHYLFDLNRDWLIQAHPETRGRAAKILEWNPHLLVDSHEMGSMDTYLFDPPGDPLNIQLSDANLKWRRLFSTKQAAAFDRHGWSYYTREWYEEWYPGYTNAWANLLGAVGLLYEQAGVNAAEVKQATGSVLTYHEAVHHQLTSSLANLETLRAQRRAILADFLADRQWAVDAERSGGEVFLVSPPADRALFDRFVRMLDRHGIKALISDGPVKAQDAVDIHGRALNGRIFPAGTLVVRAAQPHRRLLMSLLVFDQHMSDAFLHDERKDLENHRGTRVYDITAWNPCLAFGLSGYWAKGIDDVVLRSVRPRLPQGVMPPQDSPAYGFLIDGAGSDVYRLITRLLDRECKVRVATEPFAVGGYNYLPGTVLLRKHENPPGLWGRLEAAADGLDLEVRAAETALCETGPDLGGRRFKLLAQPRIAVASQWPISSTSFGSIWHLLDARTGIRTSPLSLQRLGWVDLRKYNVIIIPSVWGSGASRAVLSKSVRSRLKKWVEAGGTLIAIGGSAAFLANKDWEFSSVRLRRDVLSELATYEEALKWEQSAREVHVDPDIVWGTDDSGPAVDVVEAVSDGKKGNGSNRRDTDAEALERLDTRERMFSPNGAIVGTTLDPEHWLCFGVPYGGVNGATLPVLVSGSRVLMAKHPVKTPIRIMGADRLRLSGLIWPEARKRLANAAYVTVERVGYGQVILFANDPFFRAIFEGTGRVLLNAVLLGPGLGASETVPW